MCTMHNRMMKLFHLFPAKNSSLKDPLSGLRPYLTTERPLKMTKNTLFRVKSSFCFWLSRKTA